MIWRGIFRFFSLFHSPTYMQSSDNRHACVYESRAPSERVNESCVVSSPEVIWSVWMMQKKGEYRVESSKCPVQADSQSAGKEAAWSEAWGWDHLTLRLSFKATLKTISDLAHPEMAAAQHTRLPRPHGCSLALCGLNSTHHSEGKQKIVCKHFEEVNQLEKIHRRHWEEYIFYAFIVFGDN